MDQSRNLLLLVTASSPQCQLFIDYLHQHVDCTITVLPPGSDWKPDEIPPTLILLDVDHISEDLMQKWHARAMEDERLSLAAFNLQDEDQAIQTLSAIHLQGVFYRSDSLEMICKGLQALIDGELWMSRSLMTRMISFLRRQQLNSYRPVCGLTHRELEIIGLLGSGASNSEIADRLFVSEHTVKSHLYNIFRKIDVHNRIQAVNWARHNLGVPPPPEQKQPRRDVGKTNGLS